MLYKTIIDTLTRNEKIQLVTNVFAALSDPYITAKGVPAGKMAFLNDLMDGYPSIEELALSWDKELIEAVVEDASVKARADGIKFIVTPDLKATLNPYVNGISEDPYFCGSIGSAVASSVRKAGAACILSLLSLTESDIEFLDPEFEEMTVSDFFVSPFRIAAKECDAVMSNLDGDPKGYNNCNMTLFNAIADGYFGDKTIAISNKTDADVDFHTFLGKAAIGGAALSLERALNRYDELERFVASGSATERDFSGAISEGKAISGETLDEAVDKIIDFAFAASAITPQIGDYMPANELALKAAEESVVLLKNEKILPLTSGAKIAVLNGGEFAETLEKSFEIVTADGYDVDAVSDILTDEAVRATFDAQAVLLFLKREEWTNKLTLPPNRLKLIDALAKTGRPLIAVITGTLPIDPAFDNCFRATLIVPHEDKYGCEALRKVLVGEVNPSGRLTRTYFCGADMIFSNIASSRNSGAAKIGVFSGYRYYDKLDATVRYPFGFGLSYTKFSYSKPSIKKNKVSFMLKNTGKVDGCEIVQVYIGKTYEPLLPVKQLKAFERVYLKRGESKLVTIKLPESAFDLYDYAERDAVQCGGTYVISIGTSPLDIKLRDIVRIEGKQRSDGGGRQRDYIIGRTNIDEKSRFLRAVESDESHSKTMRVIRKSCMAAALISAFLAVLISFFVQLSGASTVASAIIATFGGLAFASAAYLIADAIISSKRKVEDYEVKLSDARMLDATPEEVFDLAFKEEEHPEQFIGDDAPKYIDKSSKYETVFSDLKSLALRRGIVISDELLRNVIAAISVTRVVIVSTDDDGEFIKFCSLLANYFGKAVHIDNGDKYISPDNLYKTWNEKKSMIESTALSDAIVEANDAPDYLHTAVVCHLSASFLASISFGGLSLEEQLKGFPPNLLIIFEVAGETLSKIPSVLAENSSILCLKFGMGTTNPSPLIQPFGFLSFMSLRERVRDEFPLDERLWKKIDKIEEMLNRGRTYKISNKLWVKLERHASTVLALGGTKHDAIDGAVASQLLPRIYPMWHMNCDRELGEVLVDLFGLNDVDACNAFLETASNKKSRE